jgi:hypothetical protein
MREVCDSQASVSKGICKKGPEKSAEQSNDLLDNGNEDVDSDLKDVGLIALALILVWGQHAEDMIKSLPDRTFFSIVHALYF